MLLVPEILPLSALGDRIMICGPSNAGKSTLAVAMGKKLDLPVVHLDQLRFLPRTDWQQRSDEEFARLHDEAIAGERWVMDGNYSGLMPGRLKRATGIVLLGANRWSNLWRYFRRTLLQKDRAGHLDGALDSVKWDMIHWILVISPQHLARYRRELPRSGLPFVEARSMRRAKELYRAWELSRQA